MVTRLNSIAHKSVFSLRFRSCTNPTSHYPLCVSRLFIWVHSLDFQPWCTFLPAQHHSCHAEILLASGSVQSLNSFRCWSLNDDHSLLLLELSLAYVMVGAKQARKPCLKSEQFWDTIHISELSREWDWGKAQRRLHLAELLLLPLFLLIHFSWEHPSRKSL